MDEVLRQYTEIAFNLLYLVTVWIIVIRMGLRLGAVPGSTRPVAAYFLWAFLWLAVGDTGHVGFRVLAYGFGGLDSNPLLVGGGALATAVTVTVYYLFLLKAWRARFLKPFSGFSWLLVGLAVLRFVVMLFPQNQWQQVVPPFTWSLARNIPLTLLGLGVAYLMYADASRVGDRAFAQIAQLITWGYVFYIPVVLFVQALPWVGMLMIPKTVTYVLVALVAWREFYR